MFVYFIFAGYRVAIGKATNIMTRIAMYQRTYLKVEVLGLIECESAEQLKATERQILKRFKPDNAFRDMFYLSSDMLDFITENTISISSESFQEYKERDNERRRERYHNDPKFRERHREADRVYRQSSKYRERRRETDRKRRQERYQNDPEYREKQRGYQRKYKARMRKTRPISENTLALPGIE